MNKIVDKKKSKVEFLTYAEKLKRERERERERTT